MTRCEHGFLQGVVECPAGCHGAVPQRKVPGRRVSTSEMIEALKSEGTVAAAARALGIPPGRIRSRAIKHPELAAVIPVRRIGHPGFQDMTGHVKGPWKVLRRTQNTGNGNATWHCKNTQCGHTQDIQGIALRSSTPACKACQRKGTKP